MQIRASEIRQGCAALWVRGYVVRSCALLWPLRPPRTCGTMCATLLATMLYEAHNGCTQCQVAFGVRNGFCCLPSLPSHSASGPYWFTINRTKPCTLSKSRFRSTRFPEVCTLPKRRLLRDLSSRCSSRACVQCLCNEDLLHHGLVERSQGQRPLKSSHGDQDLSCTTCLCIISDVRCILNFCTWRTPNMCLEKHV